jgi:hypothetical protein
MTTPPVPPTPIEETQGPFDPDMKAAGQLTSPTWELELFLSGAFVFATFQLPGLIEKLFQRLEPHTVGASNFVVFIGSLYGKAIAFTLIAMFSVHLGARAYWVALMGLHSVFPRGIQWDELKVGPLAKEIYRSRTQDIQRSIARLDNFCSVVFSVGLVIVLVFVFSTTLAGVFGGLAYLLATAFRAKQNTMFFFFALSGVFTLVPLTATLLDKRFGARMTPGSRSHRFTTGALRLAFAMNLLRFTGPMMWTMMTNMGRRKAMAFMFVTLTLLVAIATADRLANSDRLSLNSYDFFARSRAHEVLASYYENQREDGRPYPRTPSIQSDIIREPYVKLFLPISARRHNAALLRECPGLKPIGDRGLQIGADSYVPDSLAEPVLACVAKLHAVTLDSVARPDLSFSFYENPSTGIKGVITYIPADSLARGRHVLGMLPIPPEELPKGTAALNAAPWKKPILIPFWR